MPTLRLVTSAVAGPARDGGDPTPADVTVVLDTTWTPASSAAPDCPRLVAVRDTAERVLADRDLIAETSGHLDRWAAGSGVIDRLTLHDTSFWYYVRLRHWMWLQERILWAAIVDRLVTEHRPTRIACGPGVDAAARDVIGLIAARDGLEVVKEPASPDMAPAGSATSASASASAARPPRAPLPARLVRRLRRALGLSVPPDATQRRLALQEERRAIVRARLATLAAEPGRLLIVHEHAQQLVETPDGPRHMNPYLDPVMERLHGTRLEPIALDIRARATNEAAWARLTAPGAERELPSDALVLDMPVMPHAAAHAKDPAPAFAWTPPAVPIVTSGVDLAPLLVAEVSTAAAHWLPGMEGAVGRIGHLLETLRPAGILLADEYHRQDWLAAAHGLGIPVAAVQHGMIYPHHNGYIHDARPGSLRLPQRLFVFGRWERDLLVRHSVFREDEVVVGGSPRLDLVSPAEPAPRAAARAEIRRELGVKDGERLVLVSGTWGGLYRRFHYPIALAHLVDRPLPGVHVVVKLHPGEPDEGPYRAIIESAAAAGGFAPPPVTHVRSVDLYRLLAAADAHLGIHSTVLTEAVVTRTPNLLADQLAAADLLGYVPARVAIPVRDGGDLLAALALGDRALDEADARAFADAHFEPGVAGERIAADLLAWLP